MNAEKKIYILAIIDKDTMGENCDRLAVAEQFGQVLGQTWANDLAEYQTQGFNVAVEVEVPKNGGRSSCSVEITGSVDVFDFDVIDKLTNKNLVFERFCNQ